MSLNDITEPDPTPEQVAQEDTNPTSVPPESKEPSTPSPTATTAGSVTTDTSAPTASDTSANPTVDVAVESSTPTSTTASTPASTTTNTVAEISDPLLDAILGNLVPVGEAKPPMKIMLYSLPGAGKTTLGGQIPNNFIFDTEDGRLTLDENKKHMPDLVAPGSNVFKFTSFGGIERTIAKFLEAPEALSRFDTITMDTLNNLHKRGLAEITDRFHAQNPAINNQFVAETEHHTENNERVRRLVQNMIDTQRNIILFAHSRTIEPKNQTPRTFPDFSEKLANTIAGMMDAVGYVYMTTIDDKPTRVIKWRPSAEITAKSRIHGLPDNMIDPTWDKIVEAWNG